MIFTKLDICTDINPLILSELVVKNILSEDMYVSKKPYIYVDSIYAKRLFYEQHASI